MAKLIMPYLTISPSLTAYINYSPTLSSSSSASPCQEICRLVVGLNIEACSKNDHVTNTIVISRLKTVSFFIKALKSANIRAVATKDTHVRLHQV
jgi:hypothetical protein